MLNKRLAIKEFDTSYEHAYRIKFKDVRLPLFVGRNKGSVLFGKSSIGGNIITGFELSQNESKIELLLHTADDDTHLIGEIDDQDEKLKVAAEAWVVEVNKVLQESHKKAAEG